jgi:hypothetical protein
MKSQEFLKSYLKKEKSLLKKYSMKILQSISPDKNSSEINIDEVSPNSN